MELVKLFSRKRKAEEEFLSHQYEINEEMSKKRHLMEMELETEASEPAVLSAIVISYNYKSNRNASEVLMS